MVGLLTPAPARFSPFGSAGLVLADFCAFNHPAKSGSPPSSKGVGDAIDLADFVVAVPFASSARASKKEEPSPSLSSSISPHASSKAVSSGSSGVRMSGIELAEDVRTMLGCFVVAEEALSACRARLLAEEEEGRVGSKEGVVGVETGRVRDGLVTVSPSGLAAISPLAAAILFVKEEIAQPAQEAASLDGVPILGVAPLAETAPAGGRAVSGRVEPYLRTRLR